MYLRFVFHLGVACGGGVDIHRAIILRTYCQRCKLINQLAEVVTSGKLVLNKLYLKVPPVGLTVVVCHIRHPHEPALALRETKGVLIGVEKDITTFDNCSL